MIHAGRQFHETVPNRITTATYHGEPWLAFQCRKGDRREQDATTINRVRIDGWPEPFQSDASGTIDFTLRSLSNTTPMKPGDWTSYFEMHCETATGDAGQAGPFAITEEWSAGAGRAVLRGYVNNPAFNQQGCLTGLKPRTMVFQIDAMKPGQVYPFEVAFREGSDGAVEVSLYGKVVGSYRGPFGYGRRMYPQLGIYRNARDDTARMLARFDGFSVTEA